MRAGVVLRLLHCLLAGTLVTLFLATAAHGDVAAGECRVGVSRETAERLFAGLDHPPAEPSCRFEGVDTDRGELLARWSEAGEVLPPLRVLARECATSAATPTGRFIVEIPPEVIRRCPSVRSAIDSFVDQLAAERVAGTTGSLADPLYRVARAIFLVLLVIALRLLCRGAKRGMRWDRPWATLAMVGFSAALALRAALPFTLGNWYAEVLPAGGDPPWMRFGPGFYGWQSWLRSAGVWNIEALIASQLVVGAAAIPLFVGVLRQLAVPFGASAAAVVLLIFAPFHARLSASASEHVLASTLCLGFLYCWLRSARSGDRVWFLAAALTFVATCLTRVDMTVQALTMLGWPLLADPIEGDAHRRLHRRTVVAMFGLAAATAVAVYLLIAVPSRHPTPDLAGRRFALQQLLPQFWAMARNDPPWISLSSVVLAAVGAPIVLVRRPLLSLRIAATLLIAFVALGRTFLHDELVGARYFLLTIPVALIAAGYGFAALVGLAPARGRPWVGAAGLVGLVLWTGIASRSAYATRYAFQDEYSFARTALRGLPSDCDVYQVPVRADPLPRDVDCCLDLPRSPLVLEFPRLRFQPLPPDASAILSGNGCVAYYEGIGCDIPAATSELSRAAAQYFAARCHAARLLIRAPAVAETTTSARTTEGFFTAQPPHARLYRLR